MLVGTFNQMKALVGAFSIIVESSGTFGNLRFKLYCLLLSVGHIHRNVDWDPDLARTALVSSRAPAPGAVTPRPRLNTSVKKIV